MYPSGMFKTDIAITLRFGWLRCLWLWRDVSNKLKLGKWKFMRLHIFEIDDTI